MGNNKPIDERVVQKVFKMSAAGESRNTVGAFQGDLYTGVLQKTTRVNDRKIKSSG